MQSTVFHALALEKAGSGTLFLSACVALGLFLRGQCPRTVTNTQEKMSRCVFALHLIIPFCRGIPPWDGGCHFLFSVRDQSI